MFRTIVLIWTIFAVVFILGMIFEFGRTIARVFIKMAIGYYYERRVK